MGSEAEAKSASGRKRRLKTASYFVAVFLTFGIVYLKFLEQKKNNNESSTFVNNLENQKMDVDLVQKKLSVLEERCQVASYNKQEEKTNNDNNKWTTKPLWLPSYPAALEEATHKSIINTLTGLSAGGKSFYASSKKTKLRQCFGPTETATCSNVHPIVPMSEASNPETKKDKFYPEYIMAIRNPATAMPSFHNSKAIKYHGQKGQVSIDQWRQHRDTHLHEMMEQWKTVLETWKGMEASYSVGMYLVHEHLWDVDKGPNLFEELANLLENAGFSTILVKDKNTNDYDASCVWYKTMTRKFIEQYQTQHHYEYADYVPGYTKKQQNFLMKELSHLMDKYKDDTKLVSILSDYNTHIQFHLSIDQEFEQPNNSTKIA